MLAALVERVEPAAVLIAASADGKEIAGRLAVRTGSGWLNDVVALGVPTASRGARTRCSVAPSRRRRRRTPRTR